MAVTADELKDWRHRMGWTQEEAAFWLNTSVRTYQSWEQGRHRTPGMIDVVCRELETTKK
jgi:DNA-binding transcriptional regulator YiaG